MNGPKLNPTTNSPAIAKKITNSHADCTERSPAAIGKYGLFTLQHKKNELDDTLIICIQLICTQDAS